MSNIKIPPAALEAGARAFIGYIGYGVDAAVWDHLGDAYKNQLQKEMSAACIAILQAWPGMSQLQENDSASIREMAAIILPLLPQEASDDQ